MNLKKFIGLFLVFGVIVPGFRPVKALDPITIIGIIGGSVGGMYYLFSGVTWFKDKKEKKAMKEQLDTIASKLAYDEKKIEQDSKKIQNISKHHYALAGGALGLGLTAAVAATLLKDKIITKVEHASCNVMAYKKWLQEKKAMENS